MLKQEAESTRGDPTQVSEPSADELGSLEQKKIVRNKGTQGTVPLLRVTFQNAPFQDSFPRAWQVI